MPTKDEVLKFLEAHTPEKPEIMELSDNFWVDWDNDISMPIRDDNYIQINNPIGGRDLNEALEFGTLYLSVVEFAVKVREFLATP